MLYRQHELPLRTGDVVLFHTPLSFRPVSWLSWGIRQVTRSYWNHVAIVIGLEGTPYVAEALGGGVRLRPAYAYLDRKRCNIKVLRRSVPMDEGAVKGRIMTKLGTRYDTLAVLQHLYKAIRKRWTGHTGDFAESRMVCSEYVAYCLLLPEWWQVTPADLDKRPEFEVLFEEPCK